MSRAYELDAEAFAKAPLERADAFDVAADAFEEEGEVAAAIPSMSISVQVDASGRGRTTQLVNNAVQRAAQGERVVIVTRSNQEASRIDELARVASLEHWRTHPSAGDPHAAWRRIHVYGEDDMGVRPTIPDGAVVLTDPTDLDLQDRYAANRPPPPLLTIAAPQRKRG